MEVYGTSNIYGKAMEKLWKIENLWKMYEHVQNLNGKSMNMFQKNFEWLENGRGHV